MDEVYAQNRAAWRTWLEENHDKCDGVWLVYYKKHTGTPTIDYDDSVKEALCFGWVDNIIRRIDEEKHARRFTPRRAGSNWSESNKKRVAELLEEGCIAPAGLAAVAAAKASGKWDQSDRPEAPDEIPEEPAGALAAARKAP